MTLAVLLFPSLGAAEANLPVGEHRSCYDYCLDKLFSRPEEDPDFSSSHSLVVSLRVFDDRRKERQVTISERGSRGMQVVALTFDRSLSESLKACTAVAGSCDSCCDGIAVRRSVDDGDNPTVRALLDELRALSISPVTQPVIYLHGVLYEIWITSVGNQSYFSFAGPDPQRAEPFEPLESWARRVLEAVGLDSRADIQTE